MSVVPLEVVIGFLWVLMCCCYVVEVVDIVKLGGMHATQDKGTYH